MISQSQPTPKFYFDSEAHKYYIDGQLRPGVTGVLDAAGFIPYWAKNSIAAMERGSAVHLLTQYFDEGTLESYEYPQKYEPYVQSWADFVTRENRQFEYIELVMFDRERELFGGIVDRVGYDQNGERVISDIYTGEADAKYKYIQTAGYRYLISQLYPEWKDAKREILRVLPGGVTVIPCPNDADDDAAWISALNLYWWKARFSPQLLTA